MIDYFVAQYFHVFDFVYRGFHKAVSGVDDELLFFTGMDLLYRPFHFQAEAEIVKGLYNVIHSIHLIAVNRILCHACHKNQHCLCVSLPEFPRRLKPVHVRHLNVHKYHLEVHFPLFQKIHGIMKLRYTKMLILLCLKPSQSICYYFSVCIVIFYNRNAKHFSSSNPQIFPHFFHNILSKIITFFHASASF